MDKTGFGLSIESVEAASYFIYIIVHQRFN